MTKARLYLEQLRNLANNKAILRDDSERQWIRRACDAIEAELPQEPVYIDWFCTGFPACGCAEYSKTACVQYQKHRHSDIEER